MLNTNPKRSGKPQVGDTVKYSTAWLKSMGRYASGLGDRKGVITKVNDKTGSGWYVKVLWEDENEPKGVLSQNLSIFVGEKKMQNPRRSSYDIDVLDLTPDEFALREVNEERDTKLTIGLVSKSSILPVNKRAAHGVFTVKFEVGSQKPYGANTWNQIISEAERRLAERDFQRINRNPRKTKQDLLRKIYNDEYLSHYFRTALWSTNDNVDESGGEPLDRNYDVEDFESNSLQEMVNDAEEFLNTPGVRDAIESTLFDYELAAHDFWLTRNGHGAGFWDGDWPEPEATILTDIAKRFGECDIYVGDTGKLYVA